MRALTDYYLQRIHHGLIEIEQDYEQKGIFDQIHGDRTYNQLLGKLTAVTCLQHDLYPPTH